jgi:hypothetical protein
LGSAFSPYVKLLLKITPYRNFLSTLQNIAVLGRPLARVRHRHICVAHLGGRIPHVSARATARINIKVGFIDCGRAACFLVCNCCWLRPRALAKTSERVVGEKRRSPAAPPPPELRSPRADVSTVSSAADRQNMNEIDPAHEGGTADSALDAAFARIRTLPPINGAKC